MSRKVIAIVGPTSIGKSSLGVLLAHQFHGEIINGDSISVYKHLNIGSAKITEEEKQGIVHHLLDYKEVEEEYNVAIFQQDARAAIQQIWEKGKIPIIVGGTGLYIKALLYDYQFIKMDVEVPVDTTLSNEQLYQRLHQLDPDSAASIHPNNRKRLIRALQMAENGTLKSQQEEKQQHKMIYEAKIIGLTMNRDQLKERINQRVDLMMQQGLQQEAIALFKQYPLTSHSFQAIGYKEFIDYVQGKQTLDETVEMIKRHTRQFAKRQYTWFNHQMNVDWYDITDQNCQNKIIKDIKEFLHG